MIGKIGVDVAFGPVDNGGHLDQCTSILSAILYSRRRASLRGLVAPQSCDPNIQRGQRARIGFLFTYLAAILALGHGIEKQMFAMIFTYTHGYCTDIWGTSAADIWVVGWDNGDPHMQHFDGAKWSYVSPPNSEGLWGVHASSPSDAWAVGGKANILHFDGSGWTISSSELVNNTLYGVWAVSPTNVWAVGSSGTMLHFGL